MKPPTPPPRPEAAAAQQGPSRAPVAVALSYRHGQDAAPRVVARGEGPMAEQIVALARACGVEVRRNAGLARVLAGVEIDRPIPVEAYVAIAEILTYIFGRDRQRAPEPRP